jgi:hypothetical protein
MQKRRRGHQKQQDQRTITGGTIQSARRNRGMYALLLVRRERK